MTKQKTAKKKTADKATADGFANFSARLGVAASGVWGQGRYVPDMLTKNRPELEQMYRGSWIVGVAVDAVAEDMTRAGIHIRATAEPEHAQQMQAALSRQGVWRDLTSALKWARLYGGAAAAIIIDGQAPETPLDFDTIAKGQFTGLRVYDRWALEPSLTDTEGGLPRYYQAGAVRWHHSRILRFIGIELPYWQAEKEQGWGESVVERMHDRLLAFDTATQGAAQLVNRAHLRTVGIDGLREVLAAGGKPEENLLRMFHHMRMLQQNEGVTLLDKQDSFATHSYSFSGLGDMVLQFGQQIAGAVGVPLVRLFGQSPAGLNSTGEADLRMYYDNILAQQESRLRAPMMRLLHVLHRSLFAAPAPAEMDFDFIPLWQTTAKEKAEIAKALADIIGSVYDRGIIDQATAMRELLQQAETTGTFTHITPAAIDAVDFTPPPDAPEAADYEAEEAAETAAEEETGAGAMAAE